MPFDLQVLVTHSLTFRIAILCLCEKQGLDWIVGRARWYLPGKEELFLAGPQFCATMQPSQQPSQQASKSNNQTCSLHNWALHKGRFLDASSCLVILPSCHIVLLPYCQIAILSSCQLFILSSSRVICKFVGLSICQL